MTSQNATITVWKFKEKCTCNIWGGARLPSQSLFPMPTRRCARRRLYFGFMFVISTKFTASPSGGEELD